MSESICAKCKAPIIDAGFIIGNLFFHEDHFTCSECNKNLKDQNYYDKDEKYYCESDYQKLFCQKCFICGLMCAEDFAKLDSTKFVHFKCFKCEECKKEFPDKKYFLMEGKYYCLNCMESKRLCPKCNEKIIESSAVNAMDRLWHAKCFVCKVCGKGFETSGFMKHENLPVHKGNMLFN